MGNSPSLKVPKRPFRGDPGEDKRLLGRAGIPERGQANKGQNPQGMQERRKLFYLHGLLASACRP